MATNGLVEPRAVSRDDLNGANDDEGMVPPPSERIAVVVNGNAKRVNDEVIDTLDQILLAGDCSFRGASKKDDTSRAPWSSAGTERSSWAAETGPSP